MSNFGYLGISVKVKFPKEIREAAKALPEFQKDIGEAAKTLPEVAKRFGPMTKEVGRFNTLMEKYSVYLPYFLAGGALLIVTLVAVTRKGSNPK